MATVVAIMDGPTFKHNTDVLVIVEPGERRLLWVPRDLWCEGLSRRVNKAYALGGQERLTEALAEHDIVVEHCLCLRPDGIRPALEGAVLRVPVREALEVRWAGEWTRFDPPVAELEGERIHAWIGGRLLKGGQLPGFLPDLDRIRRQQELVAVMLGDRFDFGRFLEPGLPVESSGEAALAELAQVRWDWAYDTIEVTPAEIDGEEVLIRAD